MKPTITLLFIAACALLFATTEEPKPTTPTSLYIQTPPPKITTGGIYVSQSPNEILVVQGLPRTEIAVGSSVLMHDRYFRPEKPDEVTAYLCTADGRKWKAQWVEVGEHLPTR